jgi:hypothetical protein
MTTRQEVQSRTTMTPDDGQDIEDELLFSTREAGVTCFPIPDTAADD